MLICFGLASVILLVGVVFAALVIVQGEGEAAFQMFLVASVLGPSVLVAVLVTRVGLSTQAEQASADSKVR